MVMHTEGQTFEILELKDFFKNSSNLPYVTGICDPSLSYLPQSQVSLRKGKKFPLKSSQ